MFMSIFANSQALYKLLRVISSLQFIWGCLFWAVATSTIYMSSWYSFHLTCWHWWSAVRSVASVVSYIQNRYNHSLRCVFDYPSIFPLAISYRSRFSLLYNVSVDLTFSLIRNFSTIPAKIFGIMEIIHESPQSFFIVELPLIFVTILKIFN